MFDLKLFVQLAGAAQLVLVAGSVFIPRCLNWKADMPQSNTLLKQLFWTYAVYILGCHFFFGLVSVIAADALIDGGQLASLLSGLMWCWWLGRLCLQFFCFDRSCIPKTRFNGVAEALLVMLFIYLTVVYGWVFWRNLL
ncbi:hypothetical protein ACFPK9_03970 [Rubritalea spongiae]|uniref:DUF4149 domain-containing protein n=1 Tax=Rubritalea spongiae TaxID=430797 RepID=A0ABW5E496_9BACT